MNGLKQKELVEALLSAFPRYGLLKTLLMFEFDTNIDTIVTYGNLREAVEQVVEYYNKTGEIEKLVRVAKAEVPGNPLLKEFKL